jgi:putative intracellular protease/amidase
MKILIVLTSHDRLGDTGEKTGFWLEELAAPYYVFKDAGAMITLASPNGGEPPLDPKSEAPDFQTEATRRFASDSNALAQLANTFELADIAPGDFDAVFFPGGHGPVWDLAENKSVIALIEAMFSARKPVGAVCHGVAVLRHTRTQRRWLFKHRRSRDRFDQGSAVSDRGHAEKPWRPLRTRGRLGSVYRCRRQSGYRAKPGFIPRSR